MIELIQINKNDPAIIDESLNKMQYSSKYLLSLVNNILDLSRLNKNLSVTPSIFNLEELIKSTCNDFQLLSKTKNISITYHLYNTYSPEIETDVVKIRQILINLISNAIKYSPQDSNIKLTIKQEEPVNGQYNLLIIVKDNGIGISKRQQDLVFEEFKQVKEQDGSTGLGLAIVKQLITILGGEIKLHSALGVGSEFIIHLPFLPAKTTENKPIIRENTLIGKKILVVEDNEINRSIIEGLLTHQGALVELANDGTTGIEKYLESPLNFYDLILMDIRMPNLDGLEATKIIRSSKRSDAKIVKIYALSANAYPADIEKSISAGMNGHLMKPIDINEIINILTNENK